MKAVWHEEGEYPRLRWELDESAFAAFGRYGVVDMLTRGQAVFEKGDPSDSLFLVLEGAVAIVRDGVQIGVVSANHSFGEMGLLLGHPRSADAKSMTDGRVLEMSRKDIDRMIEKEPVWAARLFKVLAECLAQYLQRVGEGRASARPPRRPTSSDS
jgi:CRP-like cAMP-binding protein